MTDNENVMAVKSCKSIEDELSLIDRLKGERDCYKNELKYANIEKEALNKLCVEQKVEIEKLSNCVVMQEKLLKENEKWMESVVKNIIADEKLKAEAIKEFAERLKEKSFKPLGTWFNEKVVTENRIDNLVKEMVGDAE